MKFLPLVLFVFAACATDSSSGSGSDSGSDNGSGSGTGRTGAEAFAQECANCHGTGGTGTNDGPGILSPVTGYATYVVRNGRASQMGYAKPMAAIDSDALTDEELTAIFSFLTAVPKPTDGQGLYTRFCINCHGADGASGRVNKNIVRDVNNLSNIVRHGHGGTNYSSRTSFMPSWTTTSITDAELSAITSYVGSL